MRKFNFERLLYAILCLAFSVISCWATAESLYFSMEVPLAVCYVFAIGFLVVASLGTKWIVESFTAYSGPSNHSGKLIGGFIVTLLFWLICSMPTNTHTFVFRDVVDGVVSNDVNTTIGYLEQLNNNVTQEDLITAEKNKVQADVNNAFNNLANEIRNSNNPGFGEQAAEHLNRISQILGRNISELSFSTTTTWDKKERERLINEYRKIVDDALKVKFEEIDNRKTAKTEIFKRDAEEALNDLRAYKENIKKHKLDYQDRDTMKKLNTALLVAYGVVKEHHKFVDFAPDSDKDRYTQENTTTKVDRVISVFNVWKDVLTGKFEGKGLWYWIILAILVDVAAFIFFDLAFAKRD